MVVTHILYADESHAGREKTPCDGFYVAAGWLGEKSEAWPEFERQWCDALASESLPNFHMSKCEKGGGEFRNRAHADRERLQARFIDVIKKHPVKGVCCSVAISPFRRFESALRAKLPPHLQFLVQPHVFAMHGVTGSASRMAARQGMPNTGQIEFILDRHCEFQGRLEDLWMGGTLRSQQTIRREHLGPLRHESKDIEVCLQAADILAYEEFQRLMGKRGRWQMERLEDGGQLYSREVLGDRFMKLMIREATANNAG